MYALIQWGGLVEGQRPRTVVAYVWQRSDGWYADIIDQTGKSKYKRARKISRSEILVQFNTTDIPSKKLIENAKRQLPIVEVCDGIHDVQDSL